MRVWIVHVYDQCLFRMVSSAVLVFEDFAVLAVVLVVLVLLVCSRSMCKSEVRHLQPSRRNGLPSGDPCSRDRIRSQDLVVTCRLRYPLDQMELRVSCPCHCSSPPPALSPPLPLYPSLSPYLSLNRCLRLLFSLAERGHAASSCTPRRPHGNGRDARCKGRQGRR